MSVSTNYYDHWPVACASVLLALSAVPFAGDRALAETNALLERRFEVGLIATAWDNDPPRRLPDPAAAGTDFVTHASDSQRWEVALQPLILTSWESEELPSEPIGEPRKLAVPSLETAGPTDIPLPRLLRPPRPSPLEEPAPPVAFEIERLFRAVMHAPLGYTGPSSVLPREQQTDSHFVPVEDRWRIGFEPWDRYGQKHPLAIDYPYKVGRWWDPYNQNLLKGDYPLIGQQTFLNIEIESVTLFEGRQVPTPTTPFESTIRPKQEEFFGNPNQFFFFQPVFFRFDLFQGDAGFKPADWRLRLTPTVNANTLDVEELAIVNPDVRQGTQRRRGDLALEEWFVETKLADLGTDYDFVSVRGGSQFFVSDFRGFIFHDTNRAVRLFGTRFSNRDQFNVVWFDQTEKETNSGLNTFDDRHQNTVIINYYRQDFIWPGYTSQVSFHYNRDQPSFHFDENDILVRPDPVGVFQPHQIDSYYLGWAGDGHINRVNISHAFYYVLGRDDLNPIAGKPQDIDAQMAAIELSIDRDWVRFRTSFFWASGDEDPNDRHARGFDAIFDEPNFAGGEFSFWQRQAIQLFGTRISDTRSFVPHLRSNKIQGQTNFVNPGLFLFNVGVDAEVTPKLRLISNANFLWFDDTEVLELYTFQDNIHNRIGIDISLGAEYRPLLNDNLEIIGGISGLVPSRGFDDLFRLIRDDAPGLVAGFLEVVAKY